MPGTDPGETRPWASAHAAAGEHNLQLAEHHVPVRTPGVPVLHNPLGRQIQHPPQGVVVGEGGLALGDLPELPVQPLDDVRRVYDFTDFRRIFIERAQNFPVLLPALHAGGILRPPALRESTQLLLRLRQRRRRVDLLQVRCQVLDVLPAHIFGGAADLVDDAPL